MENLTSIIDFAKRNEAEVQAMQQHEIHNYLYNFFEANNCEILERSPHLLDVQLTIEMDKLLMNRPFIGTILKTGGVPDPMRLTLITNPENEENDGELYPLRFPRLHQIFQTTKELGSYIRLYEEIRHSRSNAYTAPSVARCKYKSFLSM